ncbi:sugar ABC transporter permease [Mycobacterium sp. ACS4331]|uniref:carbohydrate ABC transporter permease n=1 Tax=Mycobacterium sp. ACS4331 TaxID=1834121 RepID=UPI0007FC2098|nr:sugar ABC transporter permease [Mycobacterium sp. ACS4331]OBF25039.1 hypothetical protein A5727_05715 [Mycobacterium sp. ACS4331]
MTGITRAAGRRTQLGSQRKRLIAAFLLVSPAVLMMTLVIVYPAVDSVIESFRLNGQFVGLTNFATLFEDSDFWVAFRNNLILLVSIPIRIILGLVLAAIAYRGLTATKLYETAIFLPYIPSIAAVGVIFVYILNANGPLNQVLGFFGFSDLQHGWLTEPGFAMWSIMAVIVWSRLGFTFIIFSSRLAAVDRTIFQAAFVDGASWTRTFLRVGLPQLKGAIEFVAILSVVEVFAWSFAYVYVLSQGANDPSNHVLETYLYNQVFLANLPGLAAAVAVFIMAVVGILVIFRVRRTSLDLE